MTERRSGLETHTGRHRSDAVSARAGAPLLQGVRWQRYLRARAAAQPVQEDRCGGSAICEHRRRRSGCKECDGNAICEHGQRRSTCEECEDELPGKRDIESIYAAALRKLAREPGARKAREMHE